ncbi:hypothetical protein [Pseudoalteromonas rubra]|uniref:Uncharacterized protein n=1 Tax=Pseudoalteromonas rubra TaxID=43658 RepID=A0A0U3H0M7_9GAMM|nr:hypothetical protein [Pseudoalteromonas rubra]ALU46142.1 hypothetical protein AT705_24580 [Pseudoalteromonas rubra]
MDKPALTRLFGVLALGLCAGASGTSVRADDAWTHYRNNTVYQYAADSQPVITLYREFNDGRYFDTPIAHPPEYVYSYGGFYNYTLKDPSLARAGNHAFGGFSYKRPRNTRQESAPVGSEDDHLFQIKTTQYLTVMAVNLKTVAFYPHHNVEVHIKCKRLTAQAYQAPQVHLRQFRQFVTRVPATASLTGYFPEFAVKVGDLTLHEQAGELTFDSAADMRRRVGMLLTSHFRQRLATHLANNTAFPHIYACQVPLDYIPAQKPV